MSREIKFEVFDTRVNEMFGNELALKLLAQGSVMPSIHKIYRFRQYTGLKDIYESDIVSDHIAIGKVVYSENKGAYRVAYVDGTAKWFIDYTDSELKTIEVIGNIYANPELLGGDKQ